MQSGKVIQSVCTVNSSNLFTTKLLEVGLNLMLIASVIVVKINLSVTLA